MTVKIKIDDIVQAIELRWEEAKAFINKQTGEVSILDSKYIRNAEDGEPYADLGSWEQEDIKKAYDIVDDFDDIYVELPSETDMDEYHMIEDFCYSLEDSGAKDALLRTIRGKGAFRRFKDGIIDFELDQRWYTYRDECYKEAVRQFCERHGLEYVE